MKILVLQCVNNIIIIFNDRDLTEKLYINSDGILVRSHCPPDPIEHRITYATFNSYLYKFKMELEIDGNRSIEDQVRELLPEVFL